MSAKDFFKRHDVTIHDAVAPTIPVLGVVAAIWTMLAPFATEVVEIGGEAYEKSIRAIDVFHGGLIATVFSLAIVIVLLIVAADKIAAHIEKWHLVTGVIVLVVASIFLWEFILRDVVNGIEYTEAAWRALAAVVFIVAGYILYWVYRHKNMDIVK